MTDPRVVGLDLALSRTGMARADGSTCHVVVDIERTTPRTSLTRWKDIAVKAALIRDYCAPELADATLIVIEAPIVGTLPSGEPNVGAVEPLYTLHAIINLRLRHQRVVRVHPSTLKAFAGVKRKADMPKAALDAGWQPPGAPDDPDEADAFSCWLVGRHLEGDPVCEVTAARERLVSPLRKAIA